MEGGDIVEEGRRSSPPAARRRALPDRLLLPPAPREPELASSWADLPFERRRRLGHASLRGTEGLTGDDARLVTALARARVATRWRLQVAAPVWGWLVLMTIWGFGRSSFPEQESSWFAAGLTAGVVVWVSAAVAARRRVDRARAVATEAAPAADGDATG